MMPTVAIYCYLLDDSNAITLEKMLTRGAASGVYGLYHALRILIRLDENPFMSG